MTSSKTWGPSRELGWCGPMALSSFRRSGRHARSTCSQEQNKMGQAMAEMIWRSRSFSWQSPLTSPSSSSFSPGRTHHRLLRDLGRQLILAPPWPGALYCGSTDWGTLARRTSPSRPSSLPLSSELPSGLSPPPLRTPSPVTVSSSMILSDPPVMCLTCWTRYRSDANWWY